MQRKDVTFYSQGTRCAAWLYQPETEQALPCVVMAHGFGGTRVMRLDAYAQRFAEAGFAVLVFDYRHFGDSDGEPRQLLDIQQELMDWTAAIAFARSFDSIDADRIALWGTSFSGGHVIELAASDSRIAAVIAQTPFTDGLTTIIPQGIRGATRLVSAGLRDLWHETCKLPPHYVQAIGKPGALAAITAPGSFEGYQAMLPADYDVSNRVAARVLLKLTTYRPIKAASRVSAPLLVCICDQDQVTSPQAAQKTAQAAPQSEVRHYSGDHFDIYVGELFEETVKDQIAFLTQHLTVKQSRKV
jgi:cephalosporin-C deacetylase-like acetyl esterase